MKHFNINQVSSLIRVAILVMLFLTINTNSIFAGDDIKVKGAIAELGTDYLIVQSNKFFIDSSTELKGHHGSSFIFSSLVVNQLVEVRGNLMPNGSYKATRIKLEKNHDDNEFEIKGTIEELGADYLKVSDFLFYITSNTQMKGRSNSSFSFSDLSVGNIVEVKAFKNTDNSFTATRIKLEDHRRDNDLEIFGVISEISNNSFTVGIMTFTVNSSTAIMRRSNILLSFDVLQVGMRVEVKAVKQSDGSLLATRVKIEDHFGFNNEIEFTAQIENITGDLIQVGGMNFKTDENTLILDNNRLQISFSDLQVGMFVEIKGYIQTDGSILAVKIKIEDFFRDEVELKGRIDDLGTDFITVSGKAFIVNNQTLVFNHVRTQIEYSTLTIGMLVEIKGRMNPSGELVATKIKIEDEEDFEIFGTITGLFDDHFELGGNFIFVNENTVVLNHQSQPISYSDLSVGTFVEVKVIKNAADSFTALRIKIEDSPGFSKIAGIVESVSNNILNIASNNYTLNSSSVILDKNYLRTDVSSLKVGDEITLWANLKQTGEKQTLQVLLKNNSVTGINNDLSLSASFELKQNYPNPFNPTTTIAFSLQSENLVSLKIYNIIGQEIKTLLKENFSAGTYSVAFDGTGLTSGIYFYKLEVGNNIDIKKMILMK